jgi:hypothetical protein
MACLSSAKVWFTAIRTDFKSPNKGKVSNNHAFKSATVRTSTETGTSKVDLPTMSLDMPKQIIFILMNFL